MTGHDLLHDRLAIRLEGRDDAMRVVVSGSCDASCHEHLRERLFAAEAHGADRIVLDLRALRFIDSMGLRAVIAAWMRARHAERRFSIALGATGQVRRVFEVTGLERVLPVAAPV